MVDPYTKESVREIVAKELKCMGVNELPNNETLDMLGEYFMDYMMSDDIEYCLKKYWEKLEEVKNELSKKGKDKS